ncbi:MAG TPA: CmcJ/NvfI family oxidoreductase [Rhizomicrobium sp.]
MNIHALDQLAGVRATLHYLTRTGVKPYSYTFDPPPGVPPRSGEVNSVDNILIRDGRPVAGDLSLDEQGFAFRRHESRVEDFYDEDELRAVYYPEIEALLKRETGGDKVVIFDHTIRSVPKAKDGIEGMREPVRRVHNDYTEFSGVRRVHDNLSWEEAVARLRHRFLEVNVWRPIRGPLEDTPLAVLDGRTLAKEDLIPSDLIYRDKVGETYAVQYSPRHRWFYFPRMQRDEAVLIKGFDSDITNPARFAPHTGFDDPTAPSTALPRESIEVRALVFFGPPA